MNRDEELENNLKIFYHIKMKLGTIQYLTRHKFLSTYKFQSIVSQQGLKQNMVNVICRLFFEQIKLSGRLPKI